MGLARRPRRTSYLATPARHGTEYAQPPATRGSRQPPRPAKRHPGLTATRQQPRKARVPIPTMKSVQTVAPGKIEVSETGRPVPGPETCCCGSAPAASAAHTAPSADGRQAAGPRKADDPDSPGMSAGEAAETGAEVTRPKPRDRVVINPQAAPSASSSKPSTSCKPRNRTTKGLNGPPTWSGSPQPCETQDMILSCSAPSNSTTAQPRATATRRAPPTAPCAQQHLTWPNEARNRDVPHRERLSQVAHSVTVI